MKGRPLSIETTTGRVGGTVRGPMKGPHSARNQNGWERLLLEGRKEEGNLALATQNQSFQSELGQTDDPMWSVKIQTVLRSPSAARLT
jgi:hypothetical protein